MTSPSDGEVLVSGSRPAADLGGAGVASGEAARPHGRLGLPLVVLATAAWSTAGLFITAAVRGSGIDSLGLAFWRVLVTFVLLAAGVLLLRPQLLRVARRDLIWFAGMGALAVGVFQVLWVAAVLTNGMSLSTVLQCNAPVIVTILAWVFWREPLTWRKWVAVALAFAGTLLVAQPSSLGTTQITLSGLLISLGSALTYAGITLFTKKLRSSYSSWTILTYAFGFAALALLPFQFGRPLPATISSQAWMAFAGLVLITTIAGYMLYATGLKNLQASIASIVAMSEVPFAAFFGYVFLGERVNALQILGSLAVVSGVILLALQPQGTPGKAGAGE